MKEKLSQLNRERNLTLESDEASERVSAGFIRQKELKHNNEIIEKDGKKITKFRGNSEELKEYQQNREEIHKDIGKVLNISEFKNLASPKFIDTPDLTFVLNEISEIEKVKGKNEKEIEKISKDIEITTNKLNELRAKLNMPPSDDIPSLIDKKEKLSSLLLFQKKLEDKLKFENKKTGAQKEENLENTKMENKNLNEKVESINSSINNLSRLLEERESKGYTQIFENQESFRVLATKTPDVSDFEETKNYFLNIQKITKNQNNERSANDNTESLYNISSLLKRLSMNIKEFTSKIQNENKKKEMSKITFSVADNIDKVSFFVSRKAQALETYKNTRLP